MRNVLVVQCRYQNKCLRMIHCDKKAEWPHFKSIAFCIVFCLCQTVAIHPGCGPERQLCPPRFGILADKTSFQPSGHYLLAHFFFLSFFLSFSLFFSPFHIVRVLSHCRLLPLFVQTFLCPRVGRAGQL